MMRRLLYSLRFRLVAATVLVELVIVGLLLANGARLLEDSLTAQARAHNQELQLLLRAALVAPLAQRDYATLREILSELQSREGLVYLVLYDNLGQIAASVGWDRTTPLPPPDQDSALGRTEVFHAHLPIAAAGSVRGELRYGLSTRFLKDTQQKLLREGLTIAIAVLLLSLLLLTLLGYWLTRRLARLTRASQDVAAGHFDIRLPVRGSDEVATLTRSFNQMSAAVQNRIQALREAQQRFHAIADYTYDWESWLAPDGKLVWVNPSVRRITGYTPEEVIAMPDYPLPLLAPEDSEAVYAHFKRAIAGTSGDNYELRIRRKDGQSVWCSAAWQPIYGAQGEYLGIRMSIRDISELKQSQLVLQEAIEELKQSEDIQRRLLEQAHQEQARLASLLSAMNIGILFESAENRVIYVNAAFRRIWLIRDGVELTGRLTTDVLTYSANVLARPDHFSRHVLEVTSTHEVSDTFEITMADGRVVTQVSYPVRDAEGRFIGRLWIYEDVTRERQTAEQLIYLAERDSLTGLYNRHRFQEELTRMVADADRRQSHGALLFFDLDEFKYVNDTFGHRAGDAMLIRVAGEVSSLIRRNEIFSRLGGDEFAVLMPDASEKEASMLGERIVRAISQIPFRFEGQNIRLTTSLGIALYPDHADNAEELIAHADTAMYQAKEAGKNAWRVYRADLDASRQMLSRLTWNERIVNALEKGLLRLHFQGIYGAHDQRLSHLEVLVRMVDEADPDRLIMPGHFIPVAEANGKILDIDRWVITESVKLLAQAPERPSLAVNISGRSFDDPLLPQFIGETLAQHGVEPHRLMVELTETAAVSDLHDAQRFIEALHVTGCRICLDDFGSGFSSFAYLKHLKADILKIDGLFIRNLPNDYDNQVFVKAIVDVARGMRKTVIAEYVEDEDTLAMLRRFGVDLVQGYHLDMPRADHPALAGGAA
ncbi:EAL domain-containing protein [Thiobacter aerophilum]|uniref:EAL domain-containing protein n=1 Tax=Thiobacter aerophilum TaxID=3121275 RepID=A0ABV0EGE8_9BURK